MCIRVIATICVLHLAITFVPTAIAAVEVTYASMPTGTDEKPDVTTYRLTAHSDGAAILGFDFIGDPAAPVDPLASPGFFGCLCQINPAGNQTVFRDGPDVFHTFLLFDPPNPLHDSHFRLHTSNLGLLAPGSYRESNTMLQASFSAKTSFGNSVEFVQLAVPNGQRFVYRGTAKLADGTTAPLSGAFPLDGSVLCVPEPSAIVLVVLALLATNQTSARSAKNRKCQLGDTSFLPKSQPGDIPPSPKIPKALP